MLLSLALVCSGLGQGLTITAQEARALQLAQAGTVSEPKMKRSKSGTERSGPEQVEKRKVPLKGCITKVSGNNYVCQESTTPCKQKCDLFVPAK